MASVTVKVSGLRELGEAMRGLTQAMNTRTARSATFAGIKPLLAKAKELAPVAPPQVTPKIPYASLRDNIVTRKVPPSQTRFTSEHLVTIRGGRAHDWASHVGALQEFGTVVMSPQPFIRPAFETQKAAAVDATKEALKQGIDRSVRELAK